MLCPFCGTLDEDVEVPELSRAETLLTRCRACGEYVYSVPPQRRSERSQAMTVAEGESREEILATTYIAHEGGAVALRRPPGSDIDREVRDSEGKLVYYLEIKERTCSLNAYRVTKFPYAKIEEAQRLLAESRQPVHIVLKFTDCWARLDVDGNASYERGDRPFAPRYRPWQQTKERQIPVLLPVEDLEVLPWRDLCD